MKTLLLTVATTALIFAAPTAFAQDDHHHAHTGGGAPHTAPPTHVTHAPPVTHAAPVTHATSAPVVTHTRHSRHGMATTTAAPTPPPGWRVKGQSHAGRTRGGNGTHVTINFNRRNVSASHHYHFHGGAYRGPSGYSYHRYSYGETLPSIYFTQDYWISDYSDYGLAYPPDGAVWIRYGDDAILIDQDSGEILEVVYGQFY